MPLNFAFERCGFVRREEIPITSFDARILAVVRRDGGVIRNMTIVDVRESMVSVAVRFNTAAEVIPAWVNTTIFANVVQLGQVVESALDPISHVLTLKLMVSVQYPYRLINASITPVDNFTTTVAPLLAVALPSPGVCIGSGLDFATPGLGCSQYWTITVARTFPCVGGMNTLVYEGWEMFLAVTCVPDFTGSCRTPSPGIVPILFDTQSGDICPVVVDGSYSLNASVTALQVRRRHVSPHAYAFCSSRCCARVECLEHAAIPIHLWDHGLLRSARLVHPHAPSPSAFALPSCLIERALSPSHPVTISVHTLALCAFVCLSHSLALS